MPETLTVHLARPIATLQIVAAANGNRPAAKVSDCAVDTATGQELSSAQKASLQNAQETEQHEQRLAQLCQLVDSIAGKLNDLYDQTIARNQGDIARLAVEIARKILACRISQGNYDIQPVIEEALKRAPARQEIAVRVNPEDLPACQQLQQETPNGQLAELSFVSDWSIARADCLIETPKGIVKSFVEEHLTRIAEALEKAQQT